MSQIICTEGRWTAPRSRRPYAYRTWGPDTPPRALLVLIHGFAEHGGRYAPLARELARQGIAVAAPDLWGHGLSGGARGDLGSMEQSVRELCALTEAVFMPWCRQPRFAVFGHSFGGLAAIQVAQAQPAGLARAVIQSPLLEVAFPIPAWKVHMARILAVAYPGCALDMNLDVSALSHDPAVIAAYRADPLVHNKMSARTYFSLLAAREAAMRQAATIKTPVLLLCAADDRIVSIPHAKRWFDRLTCEKRYREFPGAFHELHHEPVREDALRLVAQWILAHGG